MDPTELRKVCDQIGTKLHTARVLLQQAVLAFVKIRQALLDHPPKTPTDEEQPRGDDTLVV